MRRFNLLAAEPEPVPDAPPGFAPRESAVGRAIGAEHLRGSLLEVDPGTSPWPYHWEAALEEWLLVLDGEVTLRTPAGEQPLRAGELVCFPRGPAGAHAVRNDGDRPARILFLSDDAEVNVLHYPDGDLVAVRTPDHYELYDRGAVTPPPGDPPRRFDVWDDGALETDPDDPPAFRARYASLRERIGSERLSANLLLLEQDRAVCPYHAEAIEEEWLFVLAGRPSVRVPDGREELEPGDVVCFPRGPSGAHKIANLRPEPARVLIVSERATMAASLYLDADKVGVYGPDLRLLFRRADAVDYWDGEADDPR